MSAADRPVITDQDRILAVAHVLLEFDGHDAIGPRLGAAVCEATRYALAFSVLRQLEPPATPTPRKRRPARHMEH